MTDSAVNTFKSQAESEISNRPELRMSSTPMSAHSSNQFDVGISRRQLIKHVVTGTAMSTVLGRPWLTSLIADCTPVQTGAGILRVKLSEFPALQNDGGGVRLSLNPFVASSTSVTPFYPVLINRIGAGNFVGLSSRCTHQGCVVSAYDEGSGGCLCRCHGSLFAIDGRRLSGLASSALTKYRLFFDGVDQLCIEIPGLGFSVTPSVADSSVGPRIRLQFATRRNVNYEIHYRKSISETGIVVPFSKTQDGTTTETVLTPTSNGTTTIFVDRPEGSGFYSVSIQTLEE